MHIYSVLEKYINNLNSSHFLLNPTEILYIPILTTLHFVRQQLVLIKRDSWQPVSHIVWYLPSPITRHSLPPENGYQNMICIVNFFKDCLEKIVLHFNNVKFILKTKSWEGCWGPSICLMKSSGSLHFVGIIDLANPLSERERRRKFASPYKVCDLVFSLL